MMSSDLEKEMGRRVKEMMTRLIKEELMEVIKK